MIYQDKTRQTSYSFLKSVFVKLGNLRGLFAVLLSLAILFTTSTPLVFAATNPVQNNQNTNVFEKIWCFITACKTDQIENTQPNNDFKKEVKAVSVNEKESNQILGLSSEDLGKQLAELQRSIDLFSSQQEQTSNLIKNPSFEANSSGQPTFWSYTNESAEKNTFVNNAKVRSGANALRIEPKDGKTIFGIYQSSVSTIFGRPYTLSLHISNQAGETITLKLGFWDRASNKRVGAKEFSVSADNSSSSVTVGTSSFTKYSYTLNSTSDIQAGRDYYPMIEISNAKSGNIYMDDISLTDNSGLGLFENQTLTSSLGGGSLVFDNNANIYSFTSGAGSLGLSNNKFTALYLSKATIDKDGNLSISGSTDIDGTLTVDGDSTLSGILGVSGNTTLNGNTTLGNSSSDTITTTARFNSSLIPSATNTYNLGSSSLYWDNLYARTLNISGGQSIGGSLSVTGTLGVTDAVTLSSLSTGVLQANSSGLLSSNLGTTNYLPKWNSTGLSTTSTIYDNGNIGIGTTNPTQILEIGSGNLKFNQASSPGAPTATLIETGSGNLSNGNYWYRLSYITATGETGLGTHTSPTITVDDTHKQVSLTNILTGPSGVTARKIYRSGPGTGNAYDATYKLLTTINDNTTTTYTDNTADGSLGSVGSGVNTTGGTIYAGSNSAISFDQKTGNVYIPNHLYLGPSDSFSSSVSSLVIQHDASAGGVHLNFVAPSGQYMEQYVEDNGEATLWASGGAINFAGNDLNSMNSITISDTGNGEGYNFPDIGGISVYTTAQGGYNAFVFDTTTDYPYIFRTGNVGIGTQGPDRKLDILDASNPQLRLTQTDGSIYTDMQVTSTSGAFSIVTTGGNDPDITLQPATGGEINLVANSNVYITQGGLDLGGGIISTINEISVAQNSGATDPGYTFTGDGDTGMYTSAANTLGLGTGGVEALRITSSQNLGIGTTDPGTYKAYVNGSLAVNSDTADKTGANTWGTLSDVRLKDIQGNYTLGLKEIMQLNAIKFNYKADNSLGLDSTKTYEGFSAQDVQKVIPEAVSLRSDGFLRLNADPILWAMLNAIKEQQGEIASQSAEIASQSTTLRKSIVPGLTFDSEKQTIIASSPIDFIKEAIFEGITTFKNAVIYLADVTFGGRVTFQDKDLAGYAKIKQGTKEVKITFEKPYEAQPVVNVTVKKENISFAIIDESKNGFTIKANSIASEDVNFSWIAIMIKDAKTYESDDSTLGPTPTIQAAPTIMPSAVPTDAPASTPSLAPTVEASSSAAP